MENTHKKCSKCKQDKPRSDFHADKARKSGLQPKCKICRAEAAYEKREALNKYKQDWYLANRERLLKLRKDYQKNNPQKVKENRCSHYKNNKDVYKARAKEHRRIQMETIPDIIRERQNRRERERRKNNRHRYAWRYVLRSCLARMGKTKNDFTIKLLGYSAEEFRIHIENLWTPQMSWENYGEWHIDHIKPIISFDKETTPDIVNALSNLRPLWATSRIIDGIFYEGNLNRDKYE